MRTDTPIILSLVFYCCGGGGLAAAAAVLPGYSSTFEDTMAPPWKSASTDFLVPTYVPPKTSSSSSSSTPTETETKTGDLAVRDPPTPPPDYQLAATTNGPTLRVLLDYSYPTCTADPGVRPGAGEQVESGDEVEAEHTNSTSTSTCSPLLPFDTNPRCPSRGRRRPFLRAYRSAGRETRASSRVLGPAA